MTVLHTGSESVSEWTELAQGIADGDTMPRDMAMALLESEDSQLLDILRGAFVLRQKAFGMGVWLHVIRNARSGACPEDCSYCSQSAASTADIESWPLETVESIVAGARDAHAQQAVRYCIVTSGRRPVAEDLQIICEAVRQIKQQMDIQICTSLGMLESEQVVQLRAAGVDRYNHNLETSERHYASICSTHSYADRFRTATLIKREGMELCSGGLLGLGERLEDRLDLIYALKGVDADSIPVNFLHPRAGTQLADMQPLSAPEALRALALFRYVHPQAEIRLAGGREQVLGPAQVMGLYAANSFFTKGYLTTAGQGIEADTRMLESAGFHVAGLVDA